MNCTLALAKWTRLWLFSLMATAFLGFTSASAQETDLLFMQLPTDKSHRPIELKVGSKEFTYRIEHHIQYVGTAPKQEAYFVVPLKTISRRYRQKRLANLPSRIEFKFIFRDNSEHSKGGEVQKLFFYPAKWLKFKRTYIDGAADRLNETAIAEAPFLSWGRYSNCFPPVIRSHAPTAGTTQKAKVIHRLFWLRRIHSKGGCKQHNSAVLNDLRAYINRYSSDVQPSTHYFSAHRN